MAARMRCSLWELIGPHNRPQVIRLVRSATRAEHQGRKNREGRT